MVPLYASTLEGIRAHFNIQTSILGGTDDPSRLLLLESITSLTHRGVFILLLGNVQVIDSYPSHGIMNKNQSVTTSNWPGNPSTSLQCLRRNVFKMDYPLRNLSGRAVTSQVEISTSTFSHTLALCEEISICG